MEEKIISCVGNCERLAVVENKIDKIEHVILGNGQPGALAKIHDEQSKLMEKIAHLSANLDDVVSIKKELGELRSLILKLSLGIGIVLGGLGISGKTVANIFQENPIEKPPAATE